MNFQISKVLLSLVAALTLFIGRDAVWGSPDHARQLVGTWSVQVQLNNCSGTSIGAPFKSLLTFEEGRTMIEDTTNPLFAPGQRGTGHGVWQYEGRGSYSAKSIAFLSFTTTQPPPPGFTAGTQTISQTIEFSDDPNQWTSEAKVEFADASGTVYRQACATASAQRFE